MHQDQRIGLALGVLLVGACAAFFFRNETRDVTNVPRLHNAQELDDRIAERSSRPYLKGIEAVEASDRSRTRSDADNRNPSAGMRDNQGASFWSPADELDHESPTASMQRERRPRARLTDSENDIQELAPIPVPTDDSYSQGHQTDRFLAGDREGRSSFVENAMAGRTHVVQKGETLSSIATKFLGNPGRFHEIFDANRDQLKDANDVRQGMTLSIPDLRGATPFKPSVSKASPVLESETRQQEPVETRNEDQLPLPLDSAQQSDPPRSEAQSFTPRSNVPGATILIPPELPNAVQGELQFEDSVDPPANEDVPSTKRFVPARKVPPPIRHGNPQAKANRRPDGAGRKLSQAALESASGKVAR